MLCTVSFFSQFSVLMASIAAKTILNINNHLDFVLSKLEQFSKTEWKTFGDKCGLHYNTLEAIQANNAGKPGFVEECFRDTVARWLERKDNVDGKGKPTLERLADIVEETGDKSTAEEIRNQFKEGDNEITEPIPTTPVQCSTSLWWIVTPVLVLLVAIIIYYVLRATVIDKYASELRDEYTEKLTRYRHPDINKVPIVGLSDPVYVPFVPLKLIRLGIRLKEDADFLKTAAEQILEKYESIEIDNILKPPEDKQLRFVLIEGEPGVGKSTLVKELVLRWVRKENKYLNNFKIVIFVALRLKIYQKAETFENLLINFDNINMTELVSLIKKTKGAGVLWILDGFDELPHHLRNSSTSIFIQLIKRDILPKSTVIVTTRHVASLPLYNNLEHDSKRLHVIGFSPNETREYATKYFENNETLASEFHSFYSRNTMIESMLYNPMTCFIMCTVFNDSILSNDKGYPITMTGIYNRYVRILLKRHLNDNNKAIDINYNMPQHLIHSIDFNSPELNSTWKQFYYLSELAYSGSIKQNYTFENELCELSTFMNTIISFPELQSKDESSSFIHTTLQEYFAAIYLVNNPDSMFTKEELKQNPNLEVVLTFYVGLLKLRDREVDNKTTDMILKQDHYNKIPDQSNDICLGQDIELSSLILRCLYEQDLLLNSKHFLDKEYVMSYIHTRRPRHFNSIILFYSDFEYFICGYIIAAHNIIFKVEPSSSSQIIAFRKGLQSHSSSVVFKGKIKIVIKIYNDTMLTEVLAIPSDIVIGLYLVSLPNLEILFLQKNLGNSLLKLEKLKELTLKTEKTNRSVFEALKQLTAHGRPLKRLHFCLDYASAENIRLLNLIAMQSSLEELRIKISGPLGPDPSDILFSGLFKFDLNFVWFRKNNSLRLESNRHSEFFAEHIGVMISEIRLSSFTSFTFYKENSHYLSCEVTIYFETAIYSKSATSNLSNLIKVFNDYNSFIERTPLHHKRLHKIIFEHHTVVRKCDIFSIN